MTTATFIQSPGDYERLVPYGFTHWLLEHSRFSLQAASPDPDRGFKHLATAIQAIPATDTLSFNLDILPLPEDFRAIDRLCGRLAALGVKQIRVQDPGLFHHLLRETDFDLELDPGTGGSHPAWWQVFADLAGERLRVMHLTDQATFAEVRAVARRWPGHAEMLACGPLLMLNSRRRLFRRAELPPGGWLAGEELQRPGERLHWRQTRHGTLMYHSRWRWLVPLLAAGKVPEEIRLLYDWRRVEPALIASLMELHREPPPPEDLAEVTDDLQRRFGITFTLHHLPGREPVPPREAAPPALARVLHREGSAYLLLRADTELDLSREYLLQPPGGTARQARLTDPRDCDGQTLRKVRAGELFTAATLPAIVPGTFLFPPPPAGAGAKQ